MNKLALIVCFVAVGILGSCTVTQPFDPEMRAVVIDSVLDAWHDDASHGRFMSYFDAMTDDAVFLGTDASERWTKEEFMGYAREPFSDGNGWSYTSSDRFVAFDADGDTAWVDEIMTNEKYGTLRGTAVLRLMDDDWKIAHYSLTFLVPNEKAADVVGVIRDD